MFRKVTDHQSSELGTGLFQKHLFPELYEDHIDDGDRLIVPKIPLQNTMTRRLMAETIFFLVKEDEQQYRAILNLLENLVPYDPNEEGKIFPLALYPYTKDIRPLLLRNAQPI